MRWLATAVLVAVLGCASRPPGGRMTLDECQAAVLAEKDRAAKAGRDPAPIVQRGQLTTEITRADNRAPVTAEMTKDAPDNKLVMTARIFVREDGSVSDVQVEKSSGVKSFDEAVMGSMKDWKYLPKTVDCAPVAYDYPMMYEHRFSK